MIKRKERMKNGGGLLIPGAPICSSALFRFCAFLAHSFHSTFPLSSPPLPPLTPPPLFPPSPPPPLQLFRLAPQISKRQPLLFRQHFSSIGIFRKIKQGTNPNDALKSCLSRTQEVAGAQKVVDGSTKKSKSAIERWN